MTKAYGQATTPLRDPAAKLTGAGKSMNDCGVTAQACFHRRKMTIARAGTGAANKNNNHHAEPLVAMNSTNAPAFRIGLCDDHPLFRAGVAAVLNDEADMDVVLQAGSITELQRDFAATSLDLLLLDIDLPDTTGLDALPALVVHTRVIVLSAFDEPAQVRTAMTRGAGGFLRKDIEMPNLVRAIRDVLAGRKVIDPRVALKLSRQPLSDPERDEFLRSIAELSPRHRDVLALVAQGKSTSEIADVLHISLGTAKNHITAILHILGIDDRTKLALLAAKYRADMK